LGLVASGTGDIWVEKAGDTMTGSLFLQASNFCEMGVKAFHDSLQPVCRGYRARGSVASPTAAQSGDILFGFGGFGYGATGFGGAMVAQIRFLAAENFTDSAMGANIIFLTAPIGGTSPSERMRVEESGHIGLGTTAPSNICHVKGADNTSAMQVQINATSANITASDTFIDFTNSTEVVVGNITGTAVSGVIAYNTFTGGHYVQLKNEDENPEVGMILSATGELIASEGTETLPLVKLSRERKEKSVFGVMAGKIAEKCLKNHLAGEHCDEKKDGGEHHTCDFDKGDNSKELYQVFGLGTGVILVTDTNGDIEVGDYIQSSPVAGLGERQDDDILHNYTVAKATESVDWSKETIKEKLIACTYHCS
jgi:hypothetical protein